MKDAVQSSTPPNSEPELRTVTVAHDSLPPGRRDQFAASGLPERVGERYLVRRELGSGGMAVVYEVTDSVGGQSVALKRVRRTGDERRDQELIVAFEREYHTLMQLSHPRIIEVHDFGTDDGVPYYTMELLDGGDVRECVPFGWKDACALAYDVCSSLALLHSRRLVHRDISPRNVRITNAGFAKVIDFGAMAPMGPAGSIIGTPAFLPPEVLHRSTLDARTDLFSLGATLYFALTGRPPYPAKNLRLLQEAWTHRPPAPSSIAPDVPPALDALVMALVSLDPATRPRSAFEVMQRLIVLAGLDREPPDVSEAYLSTPTIVGRDALLSELSARIRRAVERDGNGLLIEAPGGAGRTRMLDACVLAAKISGTQVLRVNASSERGEPLAVGLSLASQLVLALPGPALDCAQDLKIDATLFGSSGDEGNHSDAGEARPVLERGAQARVDLQSLGPRLAAWLLRVAEKHPLVVLVDDLEQVDPASLSLLAVLALRARRRHLFLLMTAPTEAESDATDAFAAIRRACSVVELAPLERADIEVLASSVFGDVPHLARLCECLYQVAAGNPRETLETVQTLIARGIVRYEGGEWLLPDRLCPEELPSSAIENCKLRVAELSPLARQLAELHALASHPGLGRQDHAWAARDTPASQLDAAISELVSKHILIGDGRTYALSRREWAAVLDSEIGDRARAERHQVLAEIYAKQDGRVIERVIHLLAAGCDALALDHLLPALRNTTSSQGILALTSVAPLRVAQLLDRALTSAERLGRKPRDIHELRRSVLAIAILSDEALYHRVAPALLAQLEQDSGLVVYERITDAQTPAERFMRAFAEARAHYDATAESERVLPPDEAIKGLAYFVAISIAIGSRTNDTALLRSLPGLLEPFAPLSAIMHAMWQNAIATRETVCDNRPEHARVRWFDVDAALAKVSETEMSYLAPLRAAIAYGIASVEARLGMASVETSLGALDADPMQRASAMSMRRVARLHRGDRAGAERFRKQAELLALRSNQRSMFTNTLVSELLAHATVEDLAGIREARQGISALSARFPGWMAYQHLADGYFEQVRGQFVAALSAFEKGLAVSLPDPGDPDRCTGAWPRLEGAYIETLVSLGRFEEARTRGVEALELCAAHEIGMASFVIRRALALAQARLGDFPGAAARLDGVIEELRALDIEGLELGASYEARARLAIWAGDRETAELFGRLTAQEYRYGQDSPLGARYERLMDEARTKGVAVLPELGDMRSGATRSHLTHSSGTFDAASRELSSVDTATERIRDAR